MREFDIFFCCILLEFPVVRILFSCGFSVDGDGREGVIPMGEEQAFLGGSRGETST